MARPETDEALLRKTIPAARRYLGDNHRDLLRMRWNYADALCEDDRATLDDHREAVETLIDTARTARRVLGGQHPTTAGIVVALRKAFAALRARETPPTDARQDGDLGEVEDA